MRGLLSMFVLLSLLPAGVAGSTTSNEVSRLPAATNVIQRLIDRAAEAARQTNGGYTYQRTAVIEELDSKHRVKERNEKVYEVRESGGKTLERPIKVNGTSLSSPESEREKEAERKAHEEYVRDKRDNRMQPSRRWLTHNWLDRYQWNVERREFTNNRAVLVLQFRPRTEPQPVNSLADRVTNRMIGRLWVDEADAEVIRGEARLGERITLWAGILGALDQFEVMFTRRRVDEGTWVNHLLRMEISGRKLVDSLHYRVASEARDYHRLLPTAAATTSAGAL